MRPQPRSPTSFGHPSEVRIAETDVSSRWRAMVLEAGFMHLITRYYIDIITKILYNDSALEWAFKRGKNQLLENYENAHVELSKLTDYCLNPDHERGKHKAKVFTSALGLTASDAEELRQAILEAIATNEEQPGDVDEYGSRFTVDFEMKRGDRCATIRSCWIIRTGEDFPRLTTCYVL